MKLLFGIDVDRAASQMKRETTAFQREQGVVMRKAVNLLRPAARRKLASGSPLRTGTGNQARGYGRLAQNVSATVKRTQIDVIGRVSFTAKGFYGRFHETGLNVTVSRGSGKKVRKFGRLVSERGSSYTFSLPQRKVLEPVAEANEAAVIEILGSSYGVFAP